MKAKLRGFSHRARSIAIALALTVVLLATLLPHAPLARAAAPFQLDFQANHFPFGFLQAEQVLSTDPSHPVFQLQNGTHLWYEMHTTATTGISLAADQPLTDLASAILVPASLLPPDGDIPLELAPNSQYGVDLHYSVLQVKTTFTSAGQFLDIILDPYSKVPVTLDIVGMLLQLTGQDVSGAAVGLLNIDAISRFQHTLETFTDFDSSVVDFIAFLRDVSSASQRVNALSAAQSFVKDLIALCGHAADVTMLGQLLTIYTGGVIPSSAILAGLKNLGARYNAFASLVGLGQVIEDVIITDAVYLVQGNNFPEVTLRTVLPATPTPTPLPDPQACRAIGGFADAGPASAVLNPVPAPPASLGYVKSTTDSTMFIYTLVAACSASATVASIRSFYASTMPGAGWTSSATFPYDDNLDSSCHDAYCWQMGSGALEDTQWAALEQVHQVGSTVVFQFRFAGSSNGF